MRTAGYKVVKSTSSSGAIASTAPEPVHVDKKYDPDLRNCNALAARW